LTASDGRRFTLADLDGDNDLDVAVTVEEDDESRVVLLRNQGGLSFDSEALGPARNSSQAGYYRWIEANVKMDEDQPIVSWNSRADHKYRLQFSEDGTDWTESYLSGGVPTKVSGLVGTGGGMSHTLAALDAGEIYMRVIGSARPSE
jgi:hypothetical protein